LVLHCCCYHILVFLLLLYWLCDYTSLVYFNTFLAYLNLLQKKIYFKLTYHFIYCLMALQQYNSL